MSQTEKFMENIILQSYDGENTDFPFEYSNLENTDSIQELESVSDEFIDEGGLHTNNNWYCLPYLLSNKKLSSQSNILDVKSIEIGDDITIKVVYKPFFVKNNSTEFDSESCEHYIDEDVFDTVSYVVPKDKQYICKMIIDRGINVMDTEFIKRYILA